MIKKRQRPTAYAFIDSQNLNLGVQKVGFKMDWRKFYYMLTTKYNVKKAFMFIGHMPEYEDLYMQMHDIGFLVVLKPTHETHKLPTDPNMPQKPENSEEKKIIKGNIDAELVLWAMKELSNYDKAIIVSGDGDFYCLAEYLHEVNKLGHIMTPNWQYSGLLKPFEDKIIRLDNLKRQLAYKSRSKKTVHKKI
ncbi:MAG: NYN domain-containing protein [Patescibacteria group bacterium]